MSSVDAPFRRTTLIFLILLVVLGASAGFAVAARVEDPDLQKALWTGAVTLIFGALLGGVVQLLFTDFNRRRLARAAKAEFIGNVLNDLKSVYDRVERARVLIAAHQSALTYGNEMRDLIASRVKLLNVLRALAKDPRSKWISPVNDSVRSMDHYLEGIVDEFQSTYKEVSDAQRLHEAKVALALKRLENEPAGTSVFSSNEPWERLTDLPQLTDLLASNGETRGHETRYRSEFVASLDKASHELRKELIKATS